jgi:hypothetical protein
MFKSRVDQRHVNPDLNRSTGDQIPKGIGKSDLNRSPGDCRGSAATRRE